MWEVCHQTHSKIWKDHEAEFTKTIVPDQLWDSRASAYTLGLIKKVGTWSSEGHFWRELLVCCELSHHLHTYTHIQGKEVIFSLSEERGALRYN